jgi:DNA-binding response OmpR family regulator
MSSPPTRAALIADDTAIARAAVVRRLAADGIVCVEASSAGGASAIDPSGLSCALLDLDLGDGNGVDVAVALRKRRSDLPVAFFTAGTSPAVLARASALAPVFSKPDDLDRAIAWVLACAAAAA